MSPKPGPSRVQEIDNIWPQPLASLLNPEYLQRDYDLENISAAEIPNIAKFPAKSAQDHDIDFLDNVLACAEIKTDNPREVLDLLDNQVKTRIDNNNTKNPLAAAPHYMAGDANNVLNHLRKPHSYGYSAYMIKKVDARAIKTFGKKKSQKAENTQMIVDPNWKPEVRDEDKKSKRDGLVLDRITNSRIGKQPTGKRPAGISKTQARNSKRGS